MAVDDPVLLDAPLEELVAPGEEPQGEACDLLDHGAVHDDVRRSRERPVEVLRPPGDQRVARPRRPDRRVPTGTTVEHRDRPGHVTHVLLRRVLPPRPRADETGQPTGGRHPSHHDRRFRSAHGILQ